MTTGGGVAVTVAGGAGVAVIVTGGAVVGGGAMLLLLLLLLLLLVVVVVAVVSGLADPAVRFPHPARTAIAMAPADIATADRAFMVPSLGKLTFPWGPHRRFPTLKTRSLNLERISFSSTARSSPGEGRQLFVRDCWTSVPASEDNHGIPHLALARQLIATDCWLVGALVETIRSVGLT